MAQTRSDRQTAAKKAAATRERNQQRAKSQAAGTKGAATRSPRTGRLGGAGPRRYGRIQATAGTTVGS
jgi:hypothetical protein